MGPEAPTASSELHVSDPVRVKGSFVYPKIANQDLELSLL